MEMTKTDDNDILERFLATRDSELREALIIRYLPLVRYVLGRLGISKYSSPDYEDLDGQGLLGLIEAIDHYEPTHGAKLSTYATLKIRGKILDYLRNMDWMPRTARERVKQVQVGINQLETQLQRSPTENELAHHLGMDVGVLQQTLQDSSRIMVSLDIEVDESGDNETAPVYERLFDENQENPSDLLEGKDSQLHLAEVIKKLPEKDQLVLSLYYFDGLTFKEIGEVINVSESRVCQIHGRALLSLRTALESI